MMWFVVGYICNNILCDVDAVDGHVNCSRFARELSDAYETV